MPEHARDVRGLWRKALVTVPAIVAAGLIVGMLSDSGQSNPWYAALAKPNFQPPGWVFGATWTALYAMIGVAFAALLVAPASDRRRRALGLFFVQLALNFGWPPLFFAAWMIDAGLLLIVTLIVAVASTIIACWKIRPLAGALLLPYLAWLCLAAALNYETGRLNPGADTAPLGLTGA